MQICDMVTKCDVALTPHEAFQEQCFLWEKGASVGVDFDHFNSQDLLQAPGVKICFFAFFVRVNHYYSSTGDTITQALAIV